MVLGGPCERVFYPSKGTQPIDRETLTYDKIILNTFKLKLDIEGYTPINCEAFRTTLSESL